PLWPMASNRPRDRVSSKITEAHHKALRFRAVTPASRRHESCHGGAADSECPSAAGLVEMDSQLDAKIGRIRGVGVRSEPLVVDLLTSKDRAEGFLRFGDEMASA